MATFSITSTVAIDNVTIGSNSQTVDVESVLDYTKSIGNTYAKLTTNSQQPTAASQVFIHNTGDETAIVRSTNDSPTVYYFTALPPGCSMACPLRNETVLFSDVAARTETGTTTLRIVALYI